MSTCLFLLLVCESLKSGAVIIIILLVFNSSHNTAYARILNGEPNSYNSVFHSSRHSVNVCQNELNLGTCPELDTKIQSLIQHSENESLPILLVSSLRIYLNLR